MMSDSAGENGYSSAADAYWQAGWRGILPLRHGHKGGAKSGLPSGYTGYGGVDPSYADILAWCEVFPNGNLCLRLPDDVIGIDVDNYGAKRGGLTFAEGVRRWGPLPSTIRSSSRSDGTSGIRLFRVPPGTKLETVIAFPELGLGDIEIIQHHHRYCVSWPSVHPEGPTYNWLDDNDLFVGIPSLDEVPALPQPWIDGLLARPQVALDDNAILVDVRTTLTAGEMSLGVAERLRQAIKELNLTGASRHDTCTKHVMALTRMGKNGDAGVEHALRLLCEVFKALRQSDGSDADEDPQREFLRMLTNENLARELSKPSVTDWVNEMVKMLTLAENQSPPSGGEGGDQEPGRATDAAGCVAINDTGPVRPTSKVEELEQGFWQSRESLAQVYQTAMARMASPWAVLGICAARALTMVRPNVTLPPLIGGPGSLNWFVALVARSGAGKGAANAASNLLIPKSAFKQRTLGSGEGLVKLFDRPKNADADDDLNESLLVNVDEVDTLTALSQRSASTTIAVLKQAFSGEALGFSYVNRSGVRDVEDHGYRMTLVVSVQPKKAGGLFADEGGGLPQRFMWLPAGDRRITMDESWPSTPLTLPSPSEWLYPREIIIPEEAAFAIRYNRMRNAHDELDALDGHALFCREKFAYALAVLDGRVQMTSEDWELSGIAAAVSDYTREACVDELKEAAVVDAMDRGALRGVELEAADVEKLQQQVKRGQRVMKWLLHQLDAGEGEGVPQHALVQKISGRDRKTLSEILQSGNQMIRGELHGGTVRWFRN